MRELDAGHSFELITYDGDGVERLTFMKREGIGYPGNIGHYKGTNCQEVLRALIARITYLDWQIPCWTNAVCRWLLRGVLWLFEYRAARRHGCRPVYHLRNIEHLSTCARCGHITCEHK